MNSNDIEFGSLVPFSVLNSDEIEFFTLEDIETDAVFENSEPITLNDNPVEGARVLIFKQGVSTPDAIVAKAVTDSSGFWSVNVTEFVNFDPNRRYAFIVWYPVGVLVYGAKVKIASTGGTVIINHDPLEYKERISSKRIWFNRPAIVEGFDYVDFHQRNDEEFDALRPYLAEYERLERLFPAKRNQADPGEVVSVTFNQSSGVVAEGGTLDVSATIQVNGDISDELNFFSPDESRATVEQLTNTTARITGVSAGDDPVGIVVESVADTSKSDSINITVTEAVDPGEDSTSGDIVALEGLYSSTGGSSWTTRTGWGASGMSLSPAPYGVTVVNNRVTQINLRDNNLVGQLPEILGNLKEMIYFNVKQNQLTGSLPDGIGNWSKCTHLLLNGNSSDTINQNTNRHPIYPPATSASNKFTGQLPVAWAGCTSLQFLELRGFNDGTDPAGCLTTTLPPQYSAWTDIRGIYLDAQIITSPLPPEWATMTQIRQLSLAWVNPIFETALPPEYSAWVNFRNFRLRRGTIIGGIPEAWENSFPDFRNFNVRSTGLSGTVPSWILDASSVPNLNGFVVPYTQLSGTLPPITVTNLISFETSFSPIGGELPVGLWNSPNIQLINTQGNSYTGALPPNVWGGFRNIRNLQISGNAHGGKLPLNLGDSESGQTTCRIELNSCQFTGKIPSGWVNFNPDGIYQWYFHNNFLYGQIPVGMADFKSRPQNTSGVNTDENRILHINDSTRFYNGQRVYFETTGSMPGGITAGQRYFVIDRTSSNYSISTTLGGSPVNITSGGSGTLVVRYNPWRIGQPGLRLHNNRFTYSDIIPLLNEWRPDINIEYGPQNPFPVDESDHQILRDGSGTIIPDASNVGVSSGATLTLNLSDINVTGNVYQWRRNGTPLSNGGKVSGATTHTLVVTDTSGAEQGEYTLRITNSNAPQLAESISEGITVTVS